MKTNCWLILGTMLATTAVAQVNTNTPLPEIPAPATTAPAPATPAPAVAPTDTTATNAVVKKHSRTRKKAGHKRAVAQAAERKAAETPASLVTLVPGPATVEADHVNLRGQAGLQGEVVGHVKKGDTVTVLAEITLDKPKAGEPAQWAKIALPNGARVWVDSKYLDKTSNVVAVKKLNLRGGPGENYSVLGVIEKGTAVTSVSTKGDWMEIETPASAFAFVSAQFLKQEAVQEPGVATNNPVPNNPVPPVVASAESMPPPTLPGMNPTPAPVPTAVPEAPTIAPPAATTPAVPTPAPETTTPPTPTPAPTSPTPTLATDETDTNLPPPPPRVVTHEGTVRHSVSLVAPTYFELYDPSTDKAVDYLYTTSTNLNLARYDGLHIAVTGEEAMDVRWKDTPVITIQKIYVLSTAKPVMRPARPPK